MISQHNNPLMDKAFLEKLDAYREREVYARIIALNYQEQPIECIEGRVTQGSINIDGASAVRRTCSLTLVAQDININDYYWGLKSKFKLEIGLKNTIDIDLYPEIIWFPQGTYVITGFNTSQAAANRSIAISGKDKMCFLNGDLGGSLTASIDFGVEEFYDKKTNTTTFTSIPIEKIIREAVHFYAGEPYHNIIINDLDDAAIELLEYRGDTPLYLLRNVDTDEFDNYTDNGETKVYFEDSIAENAFPISALEAHNGYYDARVELAPEAQVVQASRLKFIGSDRVYTVAKIEYGQTVGYRQTDLTYAGDLISSIGESITSILDKIKNMLGEYEYFYDLDGRFIFQKKKTYIQTSWNNIVKVGDEEYVDSVAHSSSVSYRFEDSKLITSFQNSPNLSNLKNDFSVWGERASVSGEKLPIHYRYAIDTKPTQYTTIRIEEDDIKGHNSEYPESPLYAQESKIYSTDEYDWREIIYQMAADYYQYNQLDCYTSRLIEANYPLYPYGTTGYEQYYSDIFGFWRQLYNSSPDPYYNEFDKIGDGEKFQYQDAESNDIPLFIKGTYIKADTEKDLIDDILALKKVEYSYKIEDGSNIIVNRYELLPWLEAITIDYNDSFTIPVDDGKDYESTTFYVVGPNAEDGTATYQPIRKSIKDQLQKAEIFVKEDEEYFSLLKSSYAKSSANNIADFYIFKDDGKYYNVLEMEDKDLQSVYFNDSWYNRYLYRSRFTIEGKPISTELAIKYAIDYSGEGYDYIVDEESEYRYWTKDLIEAPAQLNFWFDFMDCSEPLYIVFVPERNEYHYFYSKQEMDAALSDDEKDYGSNPVITTKVGELSQFSVKQVGDRTKAVNDSSVTAIYFREVPNLVFTTYQDYLKSDLKSQSGYTPVFMSGNLESMFSISAQGKSAQDALDELLYNYSYCIESVTLQAVPIYYLQPNTRIFVRDDASKINGEYIVSKITIPLAYNGLMSITATKAPERLY